MEKYVCVLSTDSYLDGLLILNENLKKIKSKYSLFCLVSNNVSDEIIKQIKKANIEYKIVERIEGKNKDTYNPQWYYSFDKINIFNLTGLNKIVYLDLDLLILKNIDSLFDNDHISMVKDYPFTENYNSGVMVIKPNKNDYLKMLELLKGNPEKYMGDQDIINEYFDTINELPQEFNCLRAVFYEIEDNKHNVCVFNELENPSIIHYIGELKPFMLEKDFNDDYCKIYNELFKKVKKWRKNYEKEL